MASFRLFIAINLPQEFKEKLKEIQNDLAAAISPEAFAWTKPEQCHLTLNFLGNVEVERISGLVVAIQNAVRSFGSLQLIAAGLGTFPNARRPRVVWVSVRSTGKQLANLQRATSEAVHDLTPRDDKEFVGHITIGRAKELGNRDAQLIADFIRTHAGVTLGSWTCESIELMRSDLSPNGAIHTVYESIPLGGVC